MPTRTRIIPGSYGPRTDFAGRSSVKRDSVAPVLSPGVAVDLAAIVDRYNAGTASPQEIMIVECELSLNDPKPGRLNTRNAITRAPAPNLDAEDEANRDASAARAAARSSAKLTTRKRGI